MPSRHASETYTLHGLPCLVTVVLWRRSALVAKRCAGRASSAAAGGRRSCKVVVDCVMVSVDCHLRLRRRRRRGAVRKRRAGRIVLKRALHCGGALHTLTTHHTPHSMVAALPLAPPQRRAPQLSVRLPRWSNRIDPGPAPRQLLTRTMLQTRRRSCTLACRQPSAFPHCLGRPISSLRRPARTRS